MVYCYRPTYLKPKQYRSMNITKPKPNVMTSPLFISSACKHNLRIEWLVGIPMMGGNTLATQECPGESCCQAIFGG